MKRYTPIFNQTSKKLEQIKESINGVGGKHPFKILENGKEIDRYVFLSNGKKIGVDFLENKYIKTVEINSNYIDKKFTEALFGRGKKLSNLLPKSSSISKDIFSGTEAFNDAERKIRIFLRSEHGAGNKNIFILAGMSGVGKSICAEEALNKECGHEISSSETFSKLKEISFDKADFEVRLKAYEAIEQAKNLYKRYLHNYELTSHRESFLFPEDIKQKALNAVQSRLEDELFGYKLSIEDMEGTGELNKSASDIIAKLKTLGGETVKAPYNAKNGWIKLPHEMSNHELYLQLYVANSKTLFVDEGDYFLTQSNQLMKVAFNNGPYRKVTVGKKGYLEVHDRIIPDEIMFSGKLVVTTNAPVSEWDPAIKSRANTYFFYLTLDQLFNRLQEIIPAIQHRDLPHLPKLLLVGMKNTLYNFAKSGELKTFDYRTFVSLCDEFALILEDEITKDKENDPSIDFSIYGNDTSIVTDQDLRAWKESLVGKRIWRRASDKFKKTLLHQIQAMNRAKESDDQNNVIEFTKNSEEDLL